MQLITVIMVISALTSFSSTRAFQASRMFTTWSAKTRATKRNFHSFLVADAFKTNLPSKNVGLLAQSSNENFSRGQRNNTLYMSTAAVSIAGGASILENDDDLSTTTLCEEESEIFPEEVLKHDTYNGVTIDVGKFVGGDPLDVSAFEKMLGNSLDIWRQEGKRGLWINIPTSCSGVVPICTELGFEFQFAKNGLLVMTQWLPQNSSSRLPHGPTHQVGVGVIVLHPITQKMLVVQEKTGPAAAKKLWKMPTGLTDPGEDIVDAAVREAKEETGLDLEFDRIMVMRQAHGGFFNQSDMFFICLLKLAPKYEEGLKNGEEIPLNPQEEEIAEIKWMSMDDFASQETWQGSPLYEELNGSFIKVAKSVVRGKVDLNKVNLNEEASRSGFVAKTLPIGWRPGSQTVYVSKL
jgi:8-oxo-dGTP pyrophosphatase MutT (NUDIX family)